VNRFGQIGPRQSRRRPFHQQERIARGTSPLWRSSASAAIA
jgi:hypothetical protein